MEQAGRLAGERCLIQALLLVSGPSGQLYLSTVCATYLAPAKHCQDCPLPLNRSDGTTVAQLILAASTEQ